MLKKIKPLPPPQQKLTPSHGDRKMRLGKGCADMGRHVVRPFGGMPIESFVLGHEPTEKVVKIAYDVRISVFLDRKRGRRVLDKYGEQALGYR